MKLFIYRMNTEEIKVYPANPKDAPLIAQAIIEAIGEEIADNLAGDKISRRELHELFTRLARRTDSQYSYLNSRIARTSSGIPAGVCISYDGGELKYLRRSFFKEANDKLGWGLSEKEIEEYPEECDSDEFYLDTLMTLPQFRGMGIGRKLIMDAKKKADLTGKPLGLLCDDENDRARHLYDSIGFVEIGKRPFAGTFMRHLRLS